MNNGSFIMSMRFLLLPSKIKLRKLFKSNRGREGEDTYKSGIFCGQLVISDYRYSFFVSYVNKKKSMLVTS